MSQYFNEDKLNEDMSKKLIVACSNAKRDEVERLLQQENIRRAINEKNNMGETALHVTASGGDHFIIQSLLDNGADPKISDRQGRTPLMRAALLGNLDAVQVFLAHDQSNVFDKGSTGQLPLHCACLLSSMELISQFLELDPDGNTLKARDNQGNSPFLCCAEPPCTVEALEYLLDNAADINTENDKGETALLLAARAGANPAIKFLLGKF
jgi:ankyrin repeat protein